MSVRSHDEAELWHDLHSKFVQLANEERQLVQQFVEATGRKDDPYLYAYRTPESDRWKFGGGIGEDLRERVRTLAAHAAVALGYQNGMNADGFWLHRLYHYLRDKNSKRLFERHILEPSEEAGAIRRVCKASAAFCSRLERQAIESSATIPERDSKHGKSGALKADAKYDPEVKKRSVLVRNNPGIPAREMCEIFDRMRVPLPSKWEGAGFRSWVRAFSDPNYKPRIDVIISKHKRRG